MWRARSGSPRSGRPGPVHLSLPSDLLDAQATGGRQVAADFVSESVGLTAPAADAVLALIAAAERPLLIAGPSLATRRGGELLAQLGAACGMPAVVLESPRGVADATLGAFAAVIARADLIVLLAKPLDFTLKFGDLPGPAGRRWAMIDPEGAILDRAAREAGGAAGIRLRGGCVSGGGDVARPRARPIDATRGLARRGGRAPARPAGGVGRAARRERASCIRPKCSAPCARWSRPIPRRC